MGVVQKVLALASIVLFSLGIPPYVHDTLRGITKPQRMTWGIWMGLSLVALAAQISLGARWSLLFTVLEVLGNGIIFILSMRYGVGGWRVTDRWALIVALVGVMVALLSHQPLIAIAGVILADAAGAALTVIKTFALPTSETTISWLLTGVEALFSLLLIGKPNISLMLYPGYLMLANFAVVVAQLAGRAYWRAYRRRTELV